MNRIPLRLNGGAHTTYRNWPLTQGIPFADGELPAGTPVRVVDAAGQPQPTQQQTLTTWRADGEHIRWLLIDAQAYADGGETAAWSLEIGEEGPAPAARAHHRPHPESVIRPGKQNGRPICPRGRRELPSSPTGG